MKKFSFGIISVILLILTFGVVFLMPIVAEAIGDVSLENPIQNSDLREILGERMETILFFLGSIVLLVFVVGGFTWLTSAGNPEKIKKGMNTMLYAMIGLFVIFSSYAILNTVISGLTKQERQESTEINNTPKNSNNENDCKVLGGIWDAENKRCEVCLADKDCETGEVCQKESDGYNNCVESGQ